MPEPTISPYPGLRPFRLDEDYLFFGREEQTADLVRLLREHRFLAVVGRSGSGKSSLVRAGLLPEIQGGMMQHGGSAWEIAVLRPGGHPVRNLADSLIAAGLYDGEDEEAVPRLLATLNHSALGLLEARRQSDIEEDANILIVVDQFEELFRFGQHAAATRDEAHAFVELLLEASESREAAVYVVLTMRSDYLGECSHVPGLAEAVNRGEYLIPRLTRPQLRAAIEGPAKVGGGEIAYRLAQHLLNELGDEGDQLPILQHALMRTWTFWEKDHQEGEKVDLRHYEGIGGMKLAVSNHAGEIFDALPDDRHRDVAEWVFRNLTVKGNDNRGVRRPTRLDRLGAIVGEDLATVRTVVDAYRQPGVTFLMPGEETELSGDTVIDLSHESLMRVWERLRRWADNEAQSAHIYERLVDTAKLHGEGKAGLYHDPDLAIALTWREEERPNEAWAELYGGSFDEALSFLDQSEESARRADREAEAARRQELEQARALAESRARTAGLLQRFAVTIGVALVVAVGLAVWAIQQSRKATVQSRRALAAEAKANEAAAIARHAQGRTWLAAARGLAESKDHFGARLKASRALGFEGSGRDDLTEADQEQFPVLLQQDTPAWDEALEVMGRSEGTTLLWQSGSLPQHPGEINSESVSPDGTVIASVSENESVVRVWDTRTGAAIASLETSLENPEAVAFSSQGRYLALAGGREVTFWRSENRQFTPLEEIFFSNDPTANFRCIAFSPDGRSLALGNENGDLFVWSEWSRFEEFPDEPLIWILHYGAIHDLEFQPGAGGLLATTGGQNAAIELLDGRTFARKWRLDPVERHVPGKANLSYAEKEKLWSLSFSPDGKFLAAAGERTPVTLWDMTTRQPVTTLLRDEWDQVTTDRAGTEHSDSLKFVAENVAFSPDGSKLSVSWRQGGKQGDRRRLRPTTTLFDLAAGIPSPPRLRDIVVDAGVPDRSENAKPSVRTHFSRDGARLIRTSKDRLQLLDSENGVPIGGEPVGHETTIHSLAFSRDGMLFASGDRTGDVKIWEARTGALRHTITAHLAQVEDIQFSADASKLFTVGYQDQTFKTWDVASGELLGTISKPHRVQGLDVSADGKRVVIGGWGRTLAFYDANTLEQAKTERAAHGNTPVLFPDGKHMAVYRGLGSGSDLSIYELIDSGPMEEVASHRAFYAAYLSKIAVSPDSRLLAMAFRDGAVWLWARSADGSWGEPQERRISNDGARIDAITFDDTGNRLITGDHKGMAKIWNARTGDLLNVISGPKSVTALALSPDGKLLVTGNSAGMLQMWRIPPETQIRSVVEGLGPQGGGHWFVNGSRSVALARQRRILFTTGRRDQNPNAIIAWRIQAGQLTPAFELEGHSTMPGALALSQDERYLASAPALEAGEIILWDLETKEHRIVSSRAIPASSLAFSPDGATLASSPLAQPGSNPQPVQFWDVQQHEGDPAGQSPALPGLVLGLAFTPDGGRLITTGFAHGQPIRVWEFDARERQVRMAKEFPKPNGRLTQVAVSPDGKRLASAMADGCGIQLWDLSTYEALGAPIKSRSWVASVAFSPDGSLVAFGGGFNEVRVCRGDGSGRIIATMPDASAGFTDYVGDLAFDAGGKTLIITRNDGSVLAWMIPGLAAAVDAAGYVDIVDFKDSSGGLAWKATNEFLFPQVQTASFASIPDRYLPILETAKTPSERKATLFNHYLMEKHYRAARAVLFTMDEEDRGAVQNYGQRLAGSLADDLMHTFSAGDQVNDSLVHLASEVFAEHPSSFDVQLALFTLNSDGSNIGDLLLEELSELPPSDKSERLNTFFSLLDSHLIRLLAREAVPAVDDPAVPPREVLVASYLKSLAKAFRDTSSSDPWGHASTKVGSAAEQVMNRIDEATWLLPGGSPWKFYPKLGAPGPGWKDAGFDDSAWDAGVGPIGYGSLGPGMKHGTELKRPFRSRESGQLTYYFRTEVETPGDWPEAAEVLHASYLLDDGMVLYIDGREVHRDNLPEGTITVTTEALEAVGRAGKRLWRDARLASLNLEPGRHVIAAEIHQRNANSSDLLFDLALHRPSNTWRRMESLEKTFAYLKKLDPDGSSLSWLAALDAGIPRDAPDAAFLWAFRGLLLESFGALDDFVAHADRRVAALEGDYSMAAASETKRWLARKETALLRLGRSEAELDAVREAIFAVPPRDPNSDPRQIDLTAHFNASIYDVRGWIGNADSDLRSLPETFAPRHGVSFDLRGAVQLNSGEFPVGPGDPESTTASVNSLHQKNYPDKVEGIAINQSSKAIHFLLSCHYGRETEAVEVATFLIHYDDGATGEMPVIFLDDVQDWWTGPNRAPVPEEKVGWRGTTMNGNQNVALSELVWRNPHPDRTISHIDFVSSLRATAPFLVGISLE